MSIALCMYIYIYIYIYISYSNVPEDFVYLKRHPPCPQPPADWYLPEYKLDCWVTPPSSCLYRMARPTKVMEIKKHKTINQFNMHITSRSYICEPVRSIHHWVKYFSWRKWQGEGTCLLYEVSGMYISTIWNSMEHQGLDSITSQNECKQSCYALLCSSYSISSWCIHLNLPIHFRVASLALRQPRCCHEANEAILNEKD